MWVGAGVRWARCRNAHLSLFARQCNLGLQGHRALGSCTALTALCAEGRPLQGFVEQRMQAPGTAVHLSIGEVLDDVNGAAMRQAIAALLEGIAANGGNGHSLSEIFDSCMTIGSVHSTVQSYSSASWKILREGSGLSVGAAT
uniref:Uncharacterized protein n=1 Tax=Zooxanthella nutricula TaxID=1333877 RepID=A0A6U6PZN5_9DINO